MMKISKILYFFCFLFVSFSAAAAGLNVSLDRNIVTEGDTLFLTIEYNGDSNEAPDISSLRQNFKIVSNSTSSQFIFINGQSEHVKKWVIGLQPLKAGKYVISPIKLGNLVSNTVEIEVSEMTDVAFGPDVKENSNSPYFSINQTFNNKTPYIQQQIIVFVNIYASVGLQNASLSVDEQTSQDWIVLPISNKPKIKQDIINGRQTNIATYVFAAFPQKSGTIKAPQFIFDGYYVRDSDFAFSNVNDDIMMFGVDFHNIFGQKTPVRMKTKPVDIQVKPIPEGFSVSNWLPLQDLKISSNWSIKNGFKVGEAFGRIINLEAVGMTESMLPQINFSDSVGIKQYPEKPKVSEQIIHGQFVTSAEINNVYIPTESGNLIIPETKIKWFNVKTNEPEVSVIPSETIFVTENTRTSSNPIKKIEDLKNTNASQSNTGSDTIKKSEKKSNVDIPISYIFYVFIFLLIVFLVILYCFRENKSDRISDVVRALKRHDYQKAKENLFLWAQKKFPLKKINNFKDIADLFQNENFRECLSDFNKFLYSDGYDNFDVTKFIVSLKKMDKLKRLEKKNSDVLPNLYD